MPIDLGILSNGYCENLGRNVNDLDNYIRFLLMKMTGRKNNSPR